MRTNWMILSTLVALSTGVASPQANADTLDMYVIEVKLIQTDPAGCENLSSSPRLVACEGTQAAVFVADAKVGPVTAIGREMIECGTGGLLTVKRVDGRLFLDATLTVSQPERSTADSVRIATTSLRVIEELHLGQKISASVPHNPSRRWEIRVEKWQPAVPQTAEVEGVKR